MPSLSICKPASSEQAKPGYDCWQAKGHLVRGVSETGPAINRPHQIWTCPSGSSCFFQLCLRVLPGITP